MSDIALSASQEDYLEAIYHIVEENLVARSKDLVERLQVNSSSVTQALRILGDKGLINYKPYGVVTLTERGEVRALEVIKRHKALRDFFVSILHVDEKVSEDAACRMEHDMPPIILDRLVGFMDYTSRCSTRAAEWIEGFGYACRAGAADGCEACSRDGRNGNAE